MRDDDTRKRLIALAWVAAFLVSGFLGGDSVVTMTRVGLFGQRPPLPVFHTVLRILIVVGALALLYVFQGRLERIALLVAAAAASSTVLYGIGVRSDGLSAWESDYTHSRPRFGPDPTGTGRSRSPFRAKFRLPA